MVRPHADIFITVQKPHRGRWAVPVLRERRPIALQGEWRDRTLFETDS